MSRFWFRMAWICLAIILLPACLPAAENRTICGQATFLGSSSGWIAVHAPLTGDENSNGSTQFEHSMSLSGPWIAGAEIYGDSNFRIYRWRPPVNNFPFYVRVTWKDPDGIAGTNQQILTASYIASPDATVVTNVSAVPGPEEILVKIDINGDANGNSEYEVAAGENATGPWMLRATGNEFGSKRARVRGLDANKNYWIRVAINDADGVIGSPSVVVLGPIYYNGYANLALGKILQASAFFACSPAPNQTYNNGAVQEDTTCVSNIPPQQPWYGTFNWIYVDFGAPTTFNRAAAWALSTGPWKFEYSNDASTWTTAYSSSQTCGGQVPQCAHEVFFPSVTARYLRYSEPAGIWLTELEVFLESTSWPDISTGYIDFGSVIVGQQSTAKPVVLTNLTSSPLLITAVLTPPAFPAGGCSGILNPGANCTVNFYFQPSTPGVVTGTATILTHGIATNTVLLTGNGVAPIKQASVTPNPLVFPNLRPGLTSAPLPVTVKNTGNVPLSIASVTSSNPHFQIVTGGVATITPGGIYEIDLTYTAGGTVEQESGQLTITYAGNDPAPSGVTLTGVSLIDSDGDGIPDKWEREGVTINGEFLDLPAKGASPNYPDIFVLADYMEDTATGKSFKPTQAALDSVVAAFHQVSRNPKDAFCWNGQPCTGINLHVEVPTSGVPLITMLGSWSGSVYDWSDFDKLRNGTGGQPARLSPARAAVYHYCLFAQSIGGRTGVARTNASDFVVALGDLKDPNTPGATAKPTDVQIAGTFMHELGHNLGLGDGGLASDGSPSGATYKPNYLSVMNYLFQLDGLTYSGQGGLIDYSHAKLDTLNEYKQLNEAVGLGALSQSYGTRWFCPGFIAGIDSPALTTNAPSSINWNCSGTPVDPASGKLDLTKIPADNESGIQACINGQGQPTCDAVLTGSQDWGKLKLAGGSVGSPGLPPPPPQSQTTDMTTSEASTIVPAYAVAVTPAPLKVALTGGGSQDVTFTVENRGTKADVMSVEVLPNPWAGPPQPASDGRWAPAGAGWFVSLGPGERSTLKVTVTVPGGMTGENPLIAKAASTLAPLMTDSATVPVNSGSADLAVTISAPATVTLGSPLKYQITITNRGPDAARDLRVAQQLPPGVTVQSAALAGGACVAGSPVLCSHPQLAANTSAVLSVSTVPTAAGVIATNVQAASALLDPISFNDAASATTQVYGKPVIAAAVVQKGAGTITVRMTNTGTAPAQRVTVEQLAVRVTGGTGSVTITSPALPSDVGALAPGEYRDVTVGFSAAATVKSFAITESGSAADPQGTVYRFALSQSVIL